MLPVFLRQSQVAAETLWPSMFKIFIICLFTEKRKRFLDSGLHEAFPFSNNSFFCLFLIKFHVYQALCYFWSFKNRMKPCLQAYHPQHSLPFVLLLVNIILNMMPRSKLQMRFDEYTIAISLLKQGIYRKKYSFWYVCNFSCWHIYYHFVYLACIQIF